MTLQDSSESQDRTPTAASLQFFFEPKSVAVIGASRDPAAIGYRVLDEMIRAGFRGRIYPVNPKADSICSLPAFSSVLDIPIPPQLAVVAVPRDKVLQVVDDCARAGVKALVVITAGFGEVADGIQLQQQLARNVRTAGMRMVGPNCMGLLNASPAVRLNASFSPVFPPPGVIAMSSQSGAVGLAVLGFAGQRKLGFSSFVSVGNRADVSSNDLLEYWDSDSQTKVILLYLESFGNPRRFSRIARRVSRSKPIVAVKAGRSIAGKRAAASHTAALAANDVAVDALFQQSGVIRAESLEELFDIAAAISTQPLIRGRRIGVITNAGGPGILCADACEAGGLTLPRLSETTQDALRCILPATAGISNPVDMVASADPSCYIHTIAALMASSDIDALIVIYISLDRGDSSPYIDAIRDGVEHGRSKSGNTIPILACVMSSIALEPIRTQTEFIPVYSFPEKTAFVLSRCAQYSDWLAEASGNVPQFEDIQLDVPQTIVRSQCGNDAGWLPPSDVNRILDSTGIPRVSSRTADSVDDVVAAAEAIGFPVVLKTASPAFIHKTEAGGVKLNLTDRASVRTAFFEMPDSSGVIVQKMIQGGVELLAGMSSDPQFGPLIAFGLGGIHVEILGDVQFRVTPLTDKDAREMIKRIRGHRLLEGYRGHPAADCDAIADVLLRMSYLVESIPEISEIDLNPIIALPPGQGCMVLDGRIRIRNSEINPSKPATPGTTPPQQA